MEPILDNGGIDYEYTVAAPTSSTVRAAVEAGLGVAVLPERLLDDVIVEWPRAAELDELPITCQIVRTSPGPSSTIVRSVVEAIVDEFLDLPDRQLLAE